MNATPQRRPNTWEEDIVLQYRFRKRILSASAIAYALMNVLHMLFVISTPSSLRNVRAVIFGVYLTFIILYLISQFAVNRCPACDKQNPLYRTQHSGRCKKCGVRLAPAAQHSIAEDYHVTPQGPLS